MIKSEIEELVRDDKRIIKSNCKLKKLKLYEIAKQHGFNLDRSISLAYKNIFNCNSKYNTSNEDVDFICYSAFRAKLKITFFNASYLSCITSISLNEKLIYNEPPF